MASRLTRLLKLNTVVGRRILIRNSLIISRTASYDPRNIPVPPVTPVSGPDWEDRGWKDDGLGLVDYPNLPERSYDLRNPNLKYWDQQDRRNFGEPLHEEDDILGIWMPDRYDESVVPPQDALKHLLIAFGILGFVYYLSTFYSEEDNPAAPKEYPFNNLYLEYGGDPNKDPSEVKPKRITRSYYGY